MAARAPDRRKQLARIHILKAQLGMDRDQYEAVLWTVARAHSSADLDAHGRGEVIQHMERRARDLGITATKKRKVRDRVGDDRAPMIGKVLKLLGEERGEEYALGMLRQMYGHAAPARLEWASRDQLRALISALVVDARRRAKREARS
ncbi:phage protein GemA/Gp16 family protein [Algiphilus sp.]|uniref:phage protein GemA/Gp16 family protein n=1 Tax=Algiphilus sp. TaxID=1872431 RepID=UPI0025BDC168|nr:phage protein GemA/Gp16 family protein [Algiphilus sp.]MCK5772015.1 DUF1018 domain-containing protein [Algiphilus sp.]